MSLPGYLWEKEIIMKPPMTATHRGSGAGMGNTKTLNFGAIAVSIPPKAKTAPEAPTAIVKGEGARSR